MQSLVWPERINVKDLRGKSQNAQFWGLTKLERNKKTNFSLKTLKPILLRICGAGAYRGGHSVFRVEFVKSEVKQPRPEVRNL